MDIQQHEKIEKNSAETWGRIYALIDNAIPGSLSATEVCNAAQAPRQHFEPYLERAIRLIMLNNPNDLRLTELVLKLMPSWQQVSYGQIEQENFILGFFREKSTLNTAKLDHLDGRETRRLIDRMQTGQKTTPKTHVRLGFRGKRWASKQKSREKRVR